MPKTFVISDTHFNHDLILTFKDYIGKPVREFDSVEQMNECMMDNWVSVVKPEDTIIHFGRQSGKCQNKDTYINIINYETGLEERITVEEFHERLENENSI